MRRLAILLALSLVLTSCAAIPSATDGSLAAPKATPSPVASPEPSPTPSPDPSPSPVYDDWASAYAAAFLEREDMWPVALMDIDSDGIPEAMDWITWADSPSNIACIYGYVNGRCEVLYDYATRDVTLHDIFFTQSDDIVRCIAVTNGGGIGVFLAAVHELTMQTVGGKKRLDITTYFDSVFLINKGTPPELLEEMSEGIEAVNKAVQKLYSETLTALGEEIPVRTLLVDFTETEYTETALAKKLREW